MARYRIDPARSRVFIDARSSLHPIHTEADGLVGWLELDVKDGQIVLDGTPPRGHLEFPVEKLSSGSDFEDKELRRRIDARRFPTIEGDLDSMRINGKSGTHLVGGGLTFRGVTRHFEDHMTIESDDDSTVSLKGQSVFDIRDFGMEAPRILMLKVDPEVTVSIDLVATRDAEKDGS